MKHDGLRYHDWTFAPFIAWVALVTRHSKYAMSNVCNFFALSIAMLETVREEHGTFYISLVTFFFLITFYIGAFRAEMKVQPSFVLRIFLIIFLVIDLVLYLSGSVDRLSSVFIDGLLLFGQYSLLVLRDQADVG